MTTGLTDSLPTIDRLRNDEHTGENRCFPCTLVSLAVSTGTSVAVAFHSRVGGVVLFGASLALIYLRGYFVPGLPALTKRYVPTRVFRLVDGRVKSTRPSLPNARTIEAFLRRHDALTRRDDGDFELAPSFRSAHRRRLDGYDADGELVAAAVASVFGGDGGDEFVATESVLSWRPDGVVLRYEERPVARWPSRAAFAGDVAAAAIFAERTDGWVALSPETRLRVLGALRLWYERCPACGGQITLERDDAALGSASVLAATCDDCDARIFETDYDDSLAPG